MSDTSNNTSNNGSVSDADKPMNDILARANRYRHLAATRVIAHEKSAEWHRHRGTQLGVVATAVSATVGSAVFVAVTKQLGLDGKAAVSLPSSEGWGLAAYFAFGLLLIAAPVLTAVQTYLNHPEQAGRHKVSSANYYRLQQRLELFQLRYADSATAKKEDALQELDGISKEMETVFANSLSLTNRAYTDAAVELQMRSAQGHGN